MIFEYGCASNSMVSSGSITDVTYTIQTPGNTPIPASVTVPSVTADAGCAATTMLQIDTSGSGVWEDYESTSFTQAWIINFDAVTKAFDVETGDSGLTG